MAKGISQYPMAFTIIVSMLMISLLTVVAMKSVSETAIYSGKDVIDHYIRNSFLKYVVLDGRLYFTVPNDNNGDYYALYFNGNNSVKLVKLGKTMYGGNYLLVGPLNISYNKIALFMYGKQPMIIDVLEAKAVKGVYREFLLNGTFPPSIHVNTITGSINLMKTVNGRYKYYMVSPMVPPSKVGEVKKNTYYMLNNTYDLKESKNNVTGFNLSYEDKVVDWGFVHKIFYNSSDPPGLLKTYGRLMYINNINIYSNTTYYIPYNKPWTFNGIKSNYYFYLSEYRDLGQFNLTRTNSFNKLYLNFTHSVDKIVIQGVNTGSYYTASVYVNYDVIVYVGATRHSFNYYGSFYTVTPSENVFSKTISLELELPMNISGSISIRAYISYTVYIENPSSEYVNVTLATHVVGNYGGLCAKVLSSGMVVVTGDSFGEYRFYAESKGRENIVIKTILDLNNSINAVVYDNGVMVLNTSCSYLEATYYGLLFDANTTYILPDAVIDTSGLIIENVSVGKGLAYVFNNKIGVYMGNESAITIKYVVPGVVKVSAFTYVFHEDTAIIVDLWKNLTMIYGADNTTYVNSTDIVFTQNTLIKNEMAFFEPCIELSNTGLPLVVEVDYVDKTNSSYYVSPVYGDVLVKLYPKPIAEIKMRVLDNSSTTLLYLSRRGSWVLVLKDGTIIATSEGYLCPLVKEVQTFLGRYMVLDKGSTIAIIPYTLSLNPLHYIKD